MTPARRHRERMAAIAAGVDPKPVVTSDEGGPTLPPMIRTPASAYRERIAAAAVASAPEGEVPAVDRAAAQVGLRLTHDLRRLKEIRSIDMKIAAKREMLPEYRDWIAGLIEADAGVGTGIAAEVLPTCMVWMIDVGEYAQALDLAEFVLRHGVEMPARYQRDAGTVVLEEIAEAALKAQAAGEAFPLKILDRIADLTEGLDMHDQARAKLLKAIGVEQLRAAEDMEAAHSAPALTAALETLKEAQRLHDRVGVKDKIKRADKLLQAVAPEPNNEQGGNSAA